MIYAILAIIGSVAAWLYHLVNQNGKLKEKAAQEAAKAMVKEWADLVNGLEQKIKVDERDYEEAKKRLKEDT